MKQLRAIFVFIVLVAGSAQAAIFQPLTDRQLADRADAIVVATVREAAAHVRADGYVVTDYRVDVERTLKGSATGTLTISEVGGVAGDRYTFIADSPSYTPGERVLVFLRKRGDGTYFTAGMAMGKFSYARNGRGEAIVTRSVSELREDGDRLAGAFENFVSGAESRSYAAGVTSLAFQPAPKAAASAYTLTGCGTPGCFPVRVQGGESGAGLAFKSAGSMNGVSAGNISAAAATWTGDSGSNINLTYAGTSTKTAPNADDGESTIFLGYTGADNGFCDGAFACTLGAGNFTHTFRGETFIGITDADIILRTTVQPSQAPAFLAHEMGHAIGFRHSDQGQPFGSPAIMTANVQTSVLQAWDIEALNFVYGAGTTTCTPPGGVFIGGSTIVPPGQTTTLTASATGNGTQPITYDWLEGSAVVGTGSTFTTPPITAAHTYTARAKNACSPNGVTASVTVQPQTTPNCTPPQVTSQPHAQSVTSGSTAQLSVVASGTQPLHYQWYQGNALTDTTHPLGADSAFLTTPALTQETKFFVKIVNDCGTAYSDVVTITVGGGCAKPAFTTQPSSATITAGAQTFLTAFATGATSYQWYKGSLGDTSTPVNGATPSNARWISQIYVDLLGRDADSAAQSTFGAQLSGGTPRTTVAQIVLGSTEYRQRVITSLYATFLNRTPSASELSFWLPAFAAGLTDEQVASQIAGSAEYFALSGGTNTGWLTRIYDNALGRGPTAAEVGFWSTALSTASRVTVAQSILNSAEAQTRRAQQFYGRYLRRAATATEAAGIAALLSGGATDEQVIAAILASDEYFNFGTVLVTGAVSSSTSYWVRATNACGSTDSSLATLAVPGCAAPVILTQPQDATVTVGSPSTASVVATGATSYQWYRAQSGDPSNPVPGGTGPTLTVTNVNVGPFNYWVKVSNGCQSVNSRTVTLSTTCGPRSLTASAAPSALSGASYQVSWDGDSNFDRAFELQEATKSDFSDATMFQIGQGTNAKTFTHTVTADTRYYYRVRMAPVCGGDFGPYSDTVSTLVTAPPPATQTSYSFATRPCDNCKITQNYFIEGLKPATAGDTFSVSADKPFITVSPSSGPLPAEGVTVTLTIDTTGLDIGSIQASLNIVRTPGAGKIHGLDNTPPANVPISISIVAPVAPKPKDPNAPVNAMLIPAVAHADGIGSRFVSDVRLTNTSSQSIQYQLTYTPQANDGTKVGKQALVTVNAGDTKALNDIVKDWYGSGVAGEPGIGSLEIRPLNYAGKDTVPVTLATVAASRTYAVAASGTFGQFIPALPVANFLAKSNLSKISLQQVAQSSSSHGFRTNLGFAEGSGQPVDFTVTLFDDAGHSLAERAYSLRPFESQQIKIDSFFNAAGANIPDLADGRVEIKVTSDTGRLTAYASVLDNTTTDPLLVFPADPSKISSKRYVVPGVAEFTSTLSNFHTDMRVYNGGDAPVDATFNFTGGSVPAKTLTIQPGETKAIDNVLPTLWQTTGGGSVVVSTADDSQLVVTARTYSRDATNGGTFGQFIPGVTASDAVGANERALQIVQLEESPAFRSNVGFVEVTGNDVKLEVLAYSPDSKVAARSVVPLGAGQWLQQGGLLKSLGFSSVYNGRVSVRVIEGNGRVAAYGSVVDNKTSDPTYVPAQ